jgi:signal peptidase I
MLALVPVLTLCCISLLALIVVTVQGQSMMPVLTEGDRVLALRPLLRCWIRRGRIVLVNPSGEHWQRGREEQATVLLQIKRVVALEGETAASLADSPATPVRMRG